MMMNKLQRTTQLLVAAVVLIGLAACGKVYEPEELPNAFVLPAGTEIAVTPVKNLAETGIAPGEKFAAVLEKPLYYERQKVDPEGRTFTEEVLIAPQGTPVYGTVVSKADAGDEAEGSQVGLHLAKLTLHGGMSFDVETDPLFVFQKEQGTLKPVSTATDDSVLTFTLAEPADVALVIEMRDEEAEKETDDPLLPMTTPMPPIS